MVSGSRGLDNRRELLYVDYDAAGYHSVMLDLAKPFYNDIFFEVLYADMIEDPTATQYNLNEEANLIEINMGTACQDQLASGILNIKRRYLMEPLFDSLEGDRSIDLEEHVPQFAYALFSCACLTRDFKGQWASLFRNIAVGVMFSQATNLEGIWACCRMLGFH